MNTEAKKILLTGAILLALAVMLGAFGAHALKEMLNYKSMNTFQTGITYHYYHGFALLILGLLKNQLPNLKTKFSFYAFLIGIFLFSFNCYLYGITSLKLIAMVIPLGGVLFILGWLNLAYQIYKEK